MRAVIMRTEESLLPRAYTRRLPGVPLDVIQKLCGHRDPRSTEVYAKLADQALVEAIRRPGSAPLRAAVNRESRGARRFSRLPLYDRPSRVEDLISISLRTPLPSRLRAHPEVLRRGSKSCDPVSKDRSNAGSILVRRFDDVKQPTGAGRKPSAGPCLLSHGRRMSMGVRSSSGPGTERGTRPSKKSSISFSRRTTRPRSRRPPAST